MEMELHASCLCIIIPMLLYVGLAHKAILQCGFPVLHKNIVI